MMEFTSFAELSRHLLRVASSIPKVTAVVIEKIGKNVEKTAKEKIGYYQDESGPFNGWLSLTSGTLKYHDRMGVGDSPLIITGELYASISHETVKAENIQMVTVGSNSDIGFWQEIGTNTIPPRPFIGPAMFENEKESIELIGKAVEKAF